MSDGYKSFAHKPETALRTSDILAGLAAFVVAIGVFYHFMPVEMSDNGLHYITWAGAGPSSGKLFYPPHLLHTSMIYLTMIVGSSFGDCGPTCAGIAHSMIWAAIAVGSIFVVGRVLFGSVLGALAVALLALFSHGLWIYATQAEVYAPVVGAMSLALAILFTNQAPRLPAWRIIAVAVLWAMATFYHLGNVVFFIPLFAYFIALQGKSGFGQWFFTSTLAGLIVIATFITVFIAARPEPHTVPSFLTWVLEITNRPLTDWGSVSNLFELGKLIRMVWSQIKAITVLPESLTLGIAPPFDQLPIAIIGGLIFGLAGLWNLRQIFYKNAELRWIRLFMILLFLVNFAFFGWWQPSVHKFYIPSSVPLIFLLALTFHDLYSLRENKGERTILSVMAAAFILIVFSFNLTSVKELRNGFGPFHAEAGVLDAVAPKECSIYTVGHHIGPLNFYYNRWNNIFIALPEREFYLREIGEIPQSEPPLYEGESCAVVPIGWMAPQYYNLMIGTYLEVGEWSDYVAYFVDAEPAESGNGITVNPISILNEDNGPPMVMIDRSMRVELGSIEELTAVLLASIDKALANYGEGYYPVEGNPHNLLALPRTDYQISRDRRLIFGYSWNDHGRRHLLTR